MPIISGLLLARMKGPICGGEVPTEECLKLRACRRWVVFTSFYSHAVTCLEMTAVSLFVGGGGSICSSKRASSMEYCHGSSGEGNNDNGIPVKYDVDEYYSDSAETKAVRAGGDTTRIVSTSHTAIASSTPGIGGLLFTNIASSGVITAATEASLISTNEAEGPNLTTKSEAPDGGMYLYFFLRVFSRWLMYVIREAVFRA